MWYPYAVDQIVMPEKHDNTWYKSPTGEMRYVYSWEPDGITVKVGVQSWMAVSQFLGWTIYVEDLYVECRRWAKDNGWTWVD